MTSIRILNLVLEEAESRVIVGPFLRPTSVLYRLPDRPVGLLRLGQRTAQYSRAVTHIKTARQVSVDRREERLTAASWPVPQRQWGTFQHLSSKEIEWCGVTPADRPMGDLHSR